MSDNEKSHAGKFIRDDIVSFPGGDGEPERKQGRVLRITGELTADPLVVIRVGIEGKGPVILRHASVLEMVTAAPRGVPG